MCPPNERHSSGMAVASQSRTACRKSMAFSSKLVSICMPPAGSGPCGTGFRRAARGRITLPAAQALGAGRYGLLVDGAGAQLRADLAVGEAPHPMAERRDQGEIG